MGAHCGENCYLHETTLVYNPENLKLGSNVRIDAYCVISCGERGFINIGSYTHVSSFSCLFGSYGIDIHDFSAVAAGSRIYSASDDYSRAVLIGPMVPFHTRNVRSGLVTLEKFTGLGFNSVVLPNSTLAYGSTLYGNSVLIGKTNPNSIYSGMPAKKIKDRQGDFEALEQLARAENP